MAEQDRHRYHIPEIELVERAVVLGPALRQPAGEKHEVLLRAVADLVWQPLPGILEFCDIELRQQLRFRVQLEETLLALAIEVLLLVDVLPSRSFVIPTRPLAPFHCRRDDAFRQLL